MPSRPSTTAAGRSSSSTSTSTTASASNAANTTNTIAAANSSAASSHAHSHAHSHSHPRNRNHHIQFYTSEASLFTAISSFILPSFFSSHHAAVIVATKPHLDALDNYFRTQNLAPDALRRREQLFIAPAEPILEHLTPNGEVSEQRFVDFFTPIFSRLQQKYPRLLVYGELVNILCERAEHEKAHELEMVWESFLRGRDASLLCGYNMNAFVEDGLEDVFERLCDAHSVVTPSRDLKGVASSGTGTAATAGVSTDLCVAMLQQRTLRLEMEKKKRKEAELRLQEVLEHVGELGVTLAAPATAPVVVATSPAPSPAQSPAPSRSSSATPAPQSPSRASSSSIAHPPPSPPPPQSPLQKPGIGIITATISPSGHTTIHANTRFLSLSNLSSSSPASASTWLDAVHYSDRDRVSTTLRIADGRTRTVEYSFGHDTTRRLRGVTVAKQGGYVHSVVEIVNVPEHHDGHAETRKKSTTMKQAAKEKEGGGADAAAAAAWARREQESSSSAPSTPAMNPPTKKRARNEGAYEAYEQQYHHHHHHHHHHRHHAQSHGQGYGYPSPLPPPLQQQEGAPQWHQQQHQQQQHQHQQQQQQQPQVNGEHASPPPPPPSPSPHRTMMPPQQPQPQQQQQGGGSAGAKRRKTLDGSPCF